MLSNSQRAVSKIKCLSSISFAGDYIFTRPLSVSNSLSLSLLELSRTDLGLFSPQTELLSRSLSLQVTDFFLSLPFTSFVINIYKKTLKYLWEPESVLALIAAVAKTETENNSLSK